MSYEVILTDSFLRGIRKLKNKSLENQVLTKLLDLESDPRRNKRLRHGLSEYYRIRVGKLRVLYKIYGKKVSVEALVTGHKYEQE